MIIGACGYSGSGSSAVFDFLSGFENISSYDQEFVLCHTPDGLEDLDFQLNTHCAKYTSSEVAIKRFLDMVSRHYILPSKNKNKRKAVQEITNQYIKDILVASWIGRGAADDCFHYFPIDRFIYRYSKIFLQKMPVGIKSNWNNYPAQKMFFSIKPENFMAATKKFLNQFLQIIGVDLSGTVLLNQPFSGTNPEMAFPYFDDPYAIVVDRDPRDLYVSTVKAYIPSIGPCPIPSKDVDMFIAYYKAIHAIRSTNPNVLYVQFEDLIYNFEETSKRILDFCKLDDMSNYTPVFNPRKSAVNTQTFKRFPDLSNPIRHIEDKLGDYLYDFDKYPTPEITGSIWGWG